MMRFKENNYNKLFVSVSDFIRLICGGDRLKRITNIIEYLWVYQTLLYISVVEID